MKTEKDFLWRGIPAVFYNRKYIVFSPYSNKLAHLSELDLTKNSVVRKLSKHGFFGKPLKNIDKGLFITLYLTPKCNLKCIYCFDACKKQIRDMNPETAIRYLRKILKNNNFYNGEGKLNIHFFGGEPTLNFKTIKAVVGFLENENIEVSYWINTNGITSEENIKWMVLKNFKFDIDCDGPPEIQDMQRPFKKGKGKSSFFIERLIKILVVNNAKIRTKVVVTNKNVEKMSEIVEYLVKFGISHIRLEDVIIDGRAKESNLKPINVKKFVKYFLKSIETAKKLSKEYGRRIYVSNWATRNLFEPRDHFCQFVRGNRIAILPDGTISKCIGALHKKNNPFLVGKIDEELNINENNLKKLKTISVENMEKCKSCFAKYVCSGGCFNENFQNTGSALKPNEHKCSLNKLFVRALIIKMFKDSFKHPGQPDT